MNVYFLICLCDFFSSTPWKSSAVQEAKTLLNDGSSLLNKLIWRPAVMNHEFDEKFTITLQALYANKTDENKTPGFAWALCYSPVHRHRDIFYIAVYHCRVRLGTRYKENSDVILDEGVNIFCFYQRTFRFLVNLRGFRKDPPSQASLIVAVALTTFKQVLVKPPEDVHRLQHAKTAK